MRLCQERCLDEAALWQVVWDVSRGLAFLHESSILHLDIKPENIYRDLAGAWRIGDFGLAVANESRVGRCGGWQKKGWLLFGTSLSRTLS